MALVSRREFLSLSAAGLAASMLGPSRGGAADAPFDLLSVGYLDGSESLADLRKLPWPMLQPPSALTSSGRMNQLEKSRLGSGSVVPADQMLMGDPELALESVWMRILGLHPALESGTAARFDLAELTVLFPMENPQFGEELPAIPWGARGGSLPASGMPVRHLVPLRVDGGLTLLLDLRRPGGPAERFATSFTVDPVLGLPKLQRGVYLLGFGADMWRLPRRLATSEAIAPVRDLSLVVSFERAGDEASQSLGNASVSAALASSPSSLR